MAAAVTGSMATIVSAGESFISRRWDLEEKSIKMQLPTLSFTIPQSIQVTLTVSHLQTMNMGRKCYMHGGVHLSQDLDLDSCISSVITGDFSCLF